MKWAVALVVLSAGCEQLLGISDPHGGAPADGSGSGSAIDAPSTGSDGGGMGMDGFNGMDAMAKSCMSAGTNQVVFGAATKYPVTGAVDLFVGDLDGIDGPDLVLATQTDVVFLLNDGTGHFNSGSRTLRPGEPLAADHVIVADVDGNGQLDVVSAVDGSSVVSVSLHDSAGASSFLSPLQSSIQNTSGIVALAPARFNGDTKNDVAVGTKTGTEILLATATAGSFVDQIDLGGTLLGTGDVDGDAHADVLLGLQIAPAIQFGTGTGTFKAAQTLPANSANRAALGTFSQSLDRSVVLLSAGGDIVLVPQIAARSFGQPTTFFPNLASSTLALDVLDMNGDGRDDVVVAGHMVLQCSAPAPLGEVAQQPGSPIDFDVTNPLAQRVVDLDNDGKPDLIQVDAGGNVSVQLQQ